MTITVILVVLACLWIAFSWLDRSMIGSIIVTMVIALAGITYLLDVLAGDLLRVLWLALAAAALGMRIDAYRNGSLPTRQ